ncbi:MAG TPA: EAL domain-containing protein [Burkholderiales bacterium]|nr:EAL domain-containing protein [Burkholderiales bacterium]
MIGFFRTTSLRLKLVLISFVVEAVMLTLLVANSVWLIDNVLDEQARLQMKMLGPLLNVSLAGPLADGDIASARQILAEVRAKERLAYVELFNDKGEILAGAEPSAASHYESWVTIEQEGKSYGRLRLGISTDFLAAAKQKLFLESSVIAVAEVLLSLLLFLGLGFWLTRNLKELTDAGKAVAGGNYAVRVQVVSSDEVGRLSTTFNAMAEAVQNQVKSLKEGEAKFRAIADYSYDWELWADPTGKVVWVNPSVQRLTGYSPQECLEMQGFPAAIVHPEDSDRFREGSRRILDNKTTSGSGFEFRVLRKDGISFWAAADWQPIYGARGEHLGVRGSIHDITERKQAELKILATVQQLEQAQQYQQRYYAQAQEERARFNSLLNAMDLGILFVGNQNSTAYYNPAFLRVWELPADTQLAGTSTDELLATLEKQLARSADYTQHVHEIIQTKESSHNYELTLVDGRMLLETSYPVPGADGRYMGRLWLFKDVTQERRTADQIIYLAERDALTGLYNRHRFQEELTRMLADAGRRNSAMGLLFFDLDEFKVINDTYGHRAGDSVLIRVAAEVGTQVRRNEIFSRLGGDEFAILVPDVREDELQVLAERVVHSIPQIPFHFEGHNLRLTTSLGIAVFPDHAQNAEELIAHADAAMYQAKEAGKNAWRIYAQQSDTSRQMLTRITWNERIRSALRNNLLYLDFQGVYRADDGRLSHIEALVRMKDEENLGNIVMPVSFIPLAEKSGAILEIDRWVIGQCIALLATSGKVPPISVNISARSFDDPKLPHYISDELRRLDVNPKRLIVELTETSAVADLHDAQRFIEALHQAGCRVCLDDFGSGFSSFAYLKHLQVDIVKIDGMFIRNLPNDSDNQVFVRAIVDVARGMRKITVAESVEDKETLEMLKGFGVDMLQGYYLEKPHADHVAITHIGTAV